MKMGFFRTRWIIKLLISIPLAIIIILNIQLISQIKDVNNISKKWDISHLNYKDNNNNVESNGTMNEESESKEFKTNEFFTISHNLTNEQMRSKIDILNLYPKIRNKQFIEHVIKTGPMNQNNDSQECCLDTTTIKTVYKLPEFLVIVVQIHSRLQYLKALVDSMRDVKYIENTLVVFSHDVYDNAMNEFIETIDFCATLQIFYPYSIQLYPNRFPGQDPKDCPKSVKKSEAIKLLDCQNSAFPDKYGNYREAKVSQIKHHWIWKLNFVFEELKDLKNIENLPVLLLEEDHYLFPDAIHVLKVLSEKILSDIDVVSLAHFEKSKQHFDPLHLGRYAKAIWHTSLHNTGLLLNRPQWRMIKDCSNAFCTYDDYNWDWSLQHLSQKCFHLPLVAIYPIYSRVVHMGTCGLHHKGKNCDIRENVDKLKGNFKHNRLDFFRHKFEIKGVNTAIRKVKKSNGGWSDPRDVQLCKSFFRSPNSSFNIQNIKI